ncbi:MAG: hypothetical protein ACTHJQ_27230 [Rhizobiaceae bacterium]
MTLKLNRADAARSAALAEVDRHYARKINAVLGPLAVIHMLKRNGALVDNDAEAIAARAAEQDEELAALDKERRAVKDRIRACTTAANIKTILTSLPA